eukprot:1391971-Amorphochlora_amoeboformis.AAC.1
MAFNDLCECLYSFIQRQMREVNGVIESVHNPSFTLSSCDRPDMPFSVLPRIRGIPSSPTGDLAVVG